MLWCPAVVCLALAGQDQPETRPPGERPNVVVILSDDMGFSDIGCYGGEIDTPNLDRLAAGGLRFTGFRNTGRCCPTRASLLTGLYPHQAGVGHMMEDRGHDGYRGELNDRCRTIAEVLGHNGYATAMAGKWHVTTRAFHVTDEADKANWPLQRGFDRFYGTITGAGSFYDPATLTRGNQYVTPENDPEYRPETYYYTDAISDNAARFVEQHHARAPEQPLFLYVAYTAAHWPMHALEKDVAKYKGKYDGGYESVRKARYGKLAKLGLIDPETCRLTERAGDWDAVKDKEWEARCMEVYAAMVDSMDQGIGRVVASLERTGRLDNTLILYMQDNGGCAEGMGRGRERTERWRIPPGEVAADTLQMDLWPPMLHRDGRAVLGGPDVMPGGPHSYIGYGENWANVSNTPFRLYKHWVHEGGIATPLIAHWPRAIDDGGALREHPSHLIDVMATCVDVADADYAAAFDDREKVTPLQGRSLMPAFQKQDLRREALFWEHEGNRAVLQGSWKLVARGKDGPWELYHMAKDRSESDDLAADNPQRVETMAKLWQQWAENSQVFPLDPPEPHAKQEAAAAN